MNTVKIAVVDDDQIYQFIINRTVSRLYPGSKVLNFSNCADFFNFIKRNVNTADFIPEVVLLDLNSPFMTGWEFLSSYDEIKGSLAKLPEIYLVTSSVDPKDAADAEANPLVAGFYIKPLSPEQLTEMIEKALIKHR